MPTMTRPRPGVAARRPPRARAQQRRPPTRTRASRATGTGFRPAIRRRQPQPSGIKGLMSKASSAMPSMLSGKAASKGGSSARKPAGMALLAGAAGLAYKNREKLGGMLGRHQQPDTTATGDMPSTSPAAETDARMPGV